MKVELIHYCLCRLKQRSRHTSTPTPALLARSSRCVDRLVRTAVAACQPVYGREPRDVQLRQLSQRELQPGVGVAAGRWSCSRAFQSNTVDTQPAEMPRFVPCVHVHIRQSWFAGQCGRAERLKTAVRASPRNRLLTLRVRIAGLRGRAEREGRAAAEGRQSRCEGRAPVQPVFGDLRRRAPLHL